VEKPLLTVEQAAERLNTTSRTVRNYINSGRLAGIQMSNRSWRVEEAELEAFIERNKRTRPKQQ
jgi:excisionase family DNA binding protein